MNVDVFICYRRYSAQTAKLFKRYLLKHNFSGDVWYSDSEVYGNYKADCSRLIRSAECAVIFIDPHFTDRFLDQDKCFECITAIEIVEIIKRKLQDDSFRIITIYVDRETAMLKSESEIICSLLSKDKVENPEEAVKCISQSNAVFFSTAKDDEDILFSSVFKRMLPDRYYAENKPRGNFYFGSIPTSADIILWDSSSPIESSNVYFERTNLRIPLYNRLERERSDLAFEAQNNTMISLVGTDVVLNNDTEEKILYVRYQNIKYKLFYKTLSLWTQFELNKEIASFDYRSDVYQIPNAMGMAFTVITSDKRLLFTRRSLKRGVRPGEYDCSIVEGLKPSDRTPAGDPYDTNDEHFLDYEIHRAFREEVCASDNDLDIRIYGLVLDKKYGQWNFVGTVMTPLSSEEIRHAHSLRDDTYEENEMEFVSFVDERGALSLSQIKQRLRLYIGEGIWDMALSAIYSSLRSVGFTDVQIHDMTKELL